MIKSSDEFIGHGAMKVAVRQSLADVAAQSIRDEINRGRWKAGERLPTEVQLCDMLVVSRGTLREAVRVLVAEGMLETRQGAGTFVLGPGDGGANLLRLRHTSLRDRFEMRAMLEAEAARLAALRRTPEMVEYLKEMLEQREKVPRDDRATYITRDFAFHEAIAAASGNSALIEIYAYFSKSIRESIAETLEGSIPEPSDEAHRAIFEAIVSGDPEQASATVREFMHPLLQEIERFLASS